MNDAKNAAARAHTIVSTYETAEGKREKENIIK